MDDLRRGEQFCDVVLQVGEKKINSHRLVLAAFSPYFAAMFCNPMKEKDLHVIELHDLDGAAVEDLVAYAYETRICIDERNVQAVMKAAAILQVPRVVKMCSDFLLRQIHTSNCLGICSFATSHGCVALRRAAEEYIQDHFMEVVKHEEYLHLPTESVVQLLASDYINISKEEDAFEAVLLWLCFHPSERLQHVHKLLGCIRLPCIPASFIVDRILPNSWFTQNQSCLSMIMNAMILHALPERRQPVITPNPRWSTIGTLFVIGGIDSRLESMSIECYQARKRKWYRFNRSRPPQKRLQFGLTVINQCIYIVGGRDGLRTLNTVDCYNPRSGEWRAVMAMCTPRHGVSVARLCGPLYAVGGHDGWSYLNSVERYDPETDHWSYVAPMNYARSTAGLAVLEDRMYAVGGRDSMACLNSAERYNPHTNKWTLLPPMSTKRGGLSLSAFQGRLYAVGGHDNNTPKDMVEVFDPHTNQWSLICQLTCPRDACSTVIYGNSFYVIGGYNGTEYLDLMERYNQEHDTWDQVSTLVAGRAGAGCAIFNIPIDQVPGLSMEEEQEDD
jgi:kelch-like protein 1/4/5